MNPNPLISENSSENALSEPTFRVLLAFDGSDGARAALRDLANAGLPEPLHVEVVNFADVFLPPAMPEDAEEDAARYANAPRLANVLALRQNAIEKAQRALNAAQEVAEEGANSVRSLFPTATVQTFVGADSPAWGLLAHIESTLPDLVVVGATGHSAPFGIGTLLGGVAQKIVAQSPVSVRVGRTSPSASESQASNSEASDSENEAARPLRLVVGFDGSPDAFLAVQTVASRSWPRGSAARLVTVLDDRMASEAARLSPTLSHWVEKSDDSTEFGWVEKMMDAAHQTLENSGLTVTTSVYADDPKGRLLEAARECEADCLFVGAKGLTGENAVARLERFLLGSTPTALTARASCSVEVVRK